jgi:hypothetical protein
MSIGSRLAKVLQRLDLSRRCPGPPIEIFTGTRAELDALRLPTDCSSCGRPLAEHPPGVRFVFALTDACEAGPAERNGEAGEE